NLGKVALQGGLESAFSKNTSNKILGGSTVPIVTARLAHNWVDGIGKPLVCHHREVGVSTALLPQGGQGENPKRLGSTVAIRVGEYLPGLGDFFKEQFKGLG